MHHVIVRGIEKRRIVDDDQDRGIFVGRLGDLSKSLKTGVYAWALMTNHAHILLRSGPPGLSAFMRKFLTGYASSYNRRHRRHGHLFQNRYKSIVVEEDAYFKELVRYIHLNPLRAGMVESLKQFDSLVETLRGGSRLRQVSKVRRELVNRLKELGLSLAETAGLLGVSTSGVAKILVRIGSGRSN